MWDCTRRVDSYRIGRQNIIFYVIAIRLTAFPFCFLWFVRLKDKFRLWVTSSLEIRSSFCARQPHITSQYHGGCIQMPWSSLLSRDACMSHTGRLWGLTILVLGTNINVPWIIYILLIDSSRFTLIVRNMSSLIASIYVRHLALMPMLFRNPAEKIIVFRHIYNTHLMWWLMST